MGCSQLSAVLPGDELLVILDLPFVIGLFARFPSRLWTLPPGVV